jgi:hypothetical protein
MKRGGGKFSMTLDRNRSFVTKSTKDYSFLHIKYREEIYFKISNDKLRIFKRS